MCENDCYPTQYICFNLHALLTKQYWNDNISIRTISTPTSQFKIILYSTKLYKFLLSVWCTVRTACFCWSSFVSCFSILADVTLSPEHTYWVYLLTFLAPGFLLSHFLPVSFSFFCLTWSPLNIFLSFLSLFSVPIAFTDGSQVLCPVLEPHGIQHTFSSPSVEET